MLSAMIVILSPAKTLEFERTLPCTVHSMPRFLAESEKLVQILKKKSPAQLSELMGISSELAELNHQRYRDWKPQFTTKNARQAIFTFNGPVYHGFDFMAYKKADFKRLQDTVRIISGLHGFLRPFDLIQAYRLEMGSKLENSAGKDLYSLWRQRITDSLNSECKDVLVNCASKEYSDAVDFSKLKCKVVHIIFKNFRNGKYQVVGILAKKARGMFADFMVRSNAQKVGDLKKFSRSGYAFDPKTSTDSELVFLKK
jgi:uncharacterized protein